MTDVSVIICTYNRGAYLYKALESLARQSLAVTSFEVIVVDNNSTDNTAEVCEVIQMEYDDLPLRYVVEAKQGLSHARNRGIDEARGNVLIFMDDDARADKNYLEAVLTFFMDHPSVLAAGGRIYPDWESSEPKWMSVYLRPLVSVLDMGNEVTFFRKYKYPVGANMMLHRKALEIGGYFNPELGRKGSGLQGGEEKDYFFRLQDKGVIIAYIPDAIVHHHVPDSRLEKQFIRRQAHQVGKSERIRARAQGPDALAKSLAREAIKWAASVVLYFLYMLKGQPAKAFRIIAFRAWVTRGFFMR